MSDPRATVGPLLTSCLVSAGLSAVQQVSAAITAR